MVITYHGNGYFKLQSGETIALIDPSNERSFRGATLVLRTSRNSEATTTEETDFFSVEYQGEYDISNIRIHGKTVAIEGGIEKTAYHLTFDNITIGVLGQTKSEPDSKSIDILQDCDILILPSGEKPYLSATTIAKIARQTEPGVIIPSFIKDPKELFSELGQENVRPEEKLVVKKKDITPKAMAMRWLADKK